MRWLSILVLIAMLFASRLALADDREAKTKSRALFMQGVTALEASRSAEALGLFEKAYELFPHYATLYNIGLCHRALGQRAQAANAFQRYLDDSHGTAPADDATRVRSLLGELDGRLAIVSITTSPSKARVTVDGKPLAAMAGTVRVDPGEHAIEATDPGMRPARESVSVTAGERRSIVLELLPEAAPPPAPPPAQPPPQPQPITPPPRLEQSRFGVAFWAAAGVSVAGLGTFIVAGNAAARTQDAYANAATDAQAANERSRGVTLALVADVGLVVSIVAAGVATYLALRSPDRQVR